MDDDPSGLDVALDAAVSADLQGQPRRDAGRDASEDEDVSAVKVLKVQAGGGLDEHVAAGHQFAAGVRGAHAKVLEHEPVMALGAGDGQGLHRNEEALVAVVTADGTAAA